jgi:putative DNA methylase
MTYRKKLIEVALPLEAINKASAREKSIRHGHPSTLHLWWARRPLAACRAVIFTSLVDDPDDPDAPPAFVAACRNLPRGKNAADHDTPRQRLFDFIERLVQWESTTDEEVLGTARELIRLATAPDGPPPLLDPFAGGGSIPLEAQRLGLEAHASDLNPVAVMINKALIEIPPKFADMPPVNPRDRASTAQGGSWKGAAGLAADVRYYGEWMRDRAWERIGHLYPKCNGETVIAWLWARTVKSPNPAVNAYVPLMKSFAIGGKRGEIVWLEPDADVAKQQVRFKIRKDKRKAIDRKTISAGTIDRSGGRCLLTGVPMPFEYIRSEGQAGKLGSQMIAIVTEGQNGRDYYAASPEHEHLAEIAIPEDIPNTPLPDQALGFRVQGYGMRSHKDLFTPRQLVAIVTFVDLISEVKEQVRRDAVLAGRVEGKKLDRYGKDAVAYSEAVSVYLTFVVDKLADKSSSLSWWMASAEKMAPTFSRQALSMIWDYAEMNPFCNVTSNFLASVEWVAKVLGALPVDAVDGRVENRSALQAFTSPSFPILSTDPPYYDNIGYADLSDFMYIWMRRALGDVFPEIMSTMLVPKSQELIADPGRFDGNRDRARAFFEAGLKSVFTNLRQLTATSYPMSVYYAFKQTEIAVDNESNGTTTSSTGWETFLDAVVSSGFSISGTWPIRTERSGGLRNLDRNSLASSIVLVCRPRSESASMTSRRDFVNVLRRELPPALHEMQSGNIAPVDLAQASIGPGMAVYSRYSKVLEPNGDRLTVRTALQLINQVLDEHLAEQEGHVDQDTRFAVAWFEQYGFEAGAFGVADVLARAKDTSVEGLAYAGVLESGAGKVRLYRWAELEPGWEPTADNRLTVWEATHHLIERLNTYGEEGAARLLAKMPPELAADARQLAYRLYAICERKGWAEHARDYNALVLSWSASQEQAGEFREQLAQGTLF